uniref:DUF4304 domain-containing protein n=1 Tax=Candidatus Kentrum sp. SD TaxID=2126332 RepID=A0A450YVE8_9GAMM|nr:MAG: protein of unknown function (DUF4304) [Candidatus Kentron sp. SD]VFK45528.1 MAG: protein of unknown function (DUF4304) [Candidatus Kentron sp. SD]
MLKNLIKKHVATLLKQRGFKKKELTWNKSKDGVVQVVDFQLSRFSSDEEEDFTINLGVFYSQVWKKCWGKEPPKFIKEEDCFPRIRIGKLLNGFSEKLNDRWWTCSAKTNEADLSGEIESLLEEECLPFLDDMLDQHKVIKFYSSSSDRLMPIEKIYLAIIKNGVGDINSSDDLLSEVVTISKAWADRVEQVRTHHSSTNN